MMKVGQNGNMPDKPAANMMESGAPYRAVEYWSQRKRADVDNRRLAGHVSSPPDVALGRVTPPALYCPFPSAVHADARRIEESTIAWMKRYGYVTTPSQEETARNAEFGIRAARAYPTGCVEAIQIASDLTVWLFLTDDVFEEQGISNALSVTADHVICSIRILRDPDDLPPVTNASLLALQDISRRLRVLATHEQVDRFVNGMIEFFLAVCCEAVSFSRKMLPTEADYISVRHAINCLRSVCFVFIEIAGGYELPGATWCRPDLQAVVDKAVRIISNHHDVLSGLRELSREVPMNLPAVIAREQGLSIAEAFAHVGDLVNADMRSFVNMADRLIANEDNRSVVKYVSGLKAWIRGNLDWSLMTGRYRVCDYI